MHGRARLDDIAGARGACRKGSTEIRYQHSVSGDRKKWEAEEHDITDAKRNLLRHTLVLFPTMEMDSQAESQVSERPLGIPTVPP